MDINVNIRQLQAFVLTFELGSLTKAADKMCVTQSAVSVLIRQLEDSLGVRLFDRTTRSLRPTAAGEDTFPIAERILRDVRNLEASTKGLANRARGEVNFAATAAVASSLMPPILLKFSQKYPDINVTMHDIGPDQLAQSVLADAVEFSIGTFDTDSRELAKEVLLRDYMCVVCTRDFPSAGRKTISWDDLRDVPCISTRKGSSIRRLMDQALLIRGKQFSPTYEASYLNTALSMTLAGLGVSIVPAYLVPFLQYPTLVSIRLVDPVISRELCMIRKKDRSLSSAAEGLAELMRAEIRQSALRGPPNAALAAKRA